MVGVVATMWLLQCLTNQAKIRTVQRNLKQNQSFTHLAIIWWNCESIIDMQFLSYFNHTTQLFRKLCLTDLSKICIWISSSFNETIETYFPKNCRKHHLHIFAFTSYIDLATFKPLWRHEGVAVTWCTKSRIAFLQLWLATSSFGTSLASFGWVHKFRERSMFWHYSALHVVITDIRNLVYKIYFVYI